MKGDFLEGVYDTGYGRGGGRGRGSEEARLERLERSRCACGTERFHISSQALRNVPTRLVSVSINAITRSLV